jgi:acetyl-CoA synthetase
VQLEITDDRRERNGHSGGQTAEPFNLAVDVCRQWAADRGRLALYYDDDAQGRTAAYSFWDIQREANRLSNVLAALGTLAGDRVAIVLPQCPEALIALVSICQMGAIAVPLAESLAPPAMAHRLDDSAAHLAIVDPANLLRLLPLRRQIPQLRHMIGVGGAAGNGVHSWQQVCEHASPRYTPLPTTAADPAILLYPDDWAAPSAEPVLLAHGALFDGVDAYLGAHSPFPQPGDLFWSPVAWASADGLLNVVLPTWHFGVPLLASRRPADARQVFALLDRYAVRNTVLAGETLAAMMATVADPHAAYDLDLRTLVCAGEPPGQPVVCWVQEKLGLTIQQASSHRAMPPRRAIADGANELPCERG